MLFKILIAMCAFLLGRAATAVEACEISNAALMKYEDQVLKAAGEFSRHRDSSRLLKVTEPLSCILEIQEQGSGDTKYYANSFLRPIFGGPQINGVTKDRRYKVIADELTKVSAHANLDNSLMAAHARGAWGFYKLFCEQGDIEYCATMLPSEEQVVKESDLLAASSMLTLRKAYYTLDGKQKDEVAARIKRIYRNLPLDKGLKRKVIDQIYSELFAPSTPLSLSLA